ncbi:MAG: hypothetical protein GX193_02240, partial [Clostridiales bacterium]|nr:hypothetical protein [Clostridiales bacterium]
SRANFVISDGSIAVIDVVESITKSSRESGTVLFINTKDQTMVLEVADPNGTTRNITVRVSTSTRILNAKNGAYISSLSALDIYDQLDIYGDYYSESDFDATIIVLR